MTPIPSLPVTNRRNFDSNVLAIILRTYNGRIWLWWNSSKCLKRHHKCLESTPNSLSVTFGHQNIQFREKCDPIVDRVFFTAPQIVIYSSESIPINANWNAMIPNFRIIAFNQLSPSHDRRLCPKWSRIHRKSVRIHRKSTPTHFQLVSESSQRS